MSLLDRWGHLTTRHNPSVHGHNKGESVLTHKEMTVKDDSPLLSVSDVARQLNVSSRTVNRLLTRGDIESLTIGRCRRIRPSALIRYVNALQKTQREKTVGF